MSGAIGPGAFALGCLLLTAELACAAACSWRIVGRWAPELGGAPRAAALGLCATLSVVAIQLLPLTCGVLTRGTVLVAALVLLAVVWLLTRRAPGGAPPDANSTGPAAGLDPAAGSAVPAGDPPTPARPTAFGLPAASWLLAAAGIALFCGFALAYLEFASTYKPVSVDALGFHFPGVIRFIQSGTLWQSTQYLPGQAQGNYPQSGDMLMLAVVLPFHSLALVRLADPLLLLVAALAVYDSGRELGAPAPTAVLAALAVLAIRPTLAPALTDVLTDPAFVAGFACGTLFLLRHWRTAARSDLALAGAGFGLALGAKWYGLTDIPAVAIVWLLAAIVRDRSWRRAARDLGGLVIAVLLTGGIWLLRNWVLTGNPVFDYKVSPLGLTIFHAPPDPYRSRIGYTLAHYIPHPTIAKDYIWPVFRADFGLTGALLVAGGAFTLALLAVPGLRRRFAISAPSRLWILLVAAVLCAIAYAVTPYSAQGYINMPVLVNANTRYGTPALLLAAPLTAWAASRLGPLRTALDAALLAWVIVDLRRYLVSSSGRIVLNVVLVLVVAAAWAALSLRAGDLRRAWQPAAALLAALAVGIASFHYERVLARRPYLPEDATIDWVLQHAPSGVRIGVTGLWSGQGVTPTAPLFGPRFGNHVTYVGPWVQHRLEQYGRRAPFIAALRRDHLPLLDIGISFTKQGMNEARWAYAAGYRVITASPRLILMGRAGA